MSIEFKNSDRRFRILFENSLAVMLIIDPETHRIEAANNAAEKFYGWKRREIETMRVDDINTLSPAEIKTEMGKARKSERNYFRVEHRLASGEVRNVEIYSGKVQIDGKDYLHSIVHDITEQVDADEALKESQTYNRMLFKQSPIGLALTDMDGKLIDINPAFAVILGRSVEEAKSLSYWDITPEKYAATEQEQLALLEKTGRYGPYEKDYIHKDGHLVPVRLQGLIIEREGKKYIWSSVENISEQKLAEEGLRKSEEQYRTLFENMNAGFELFEVVQNEQGIPVDLKIIAANEGFEKTTGLKLKDSVGMHLTQVLPGIEKDEADWIGTFSKVALTGESVLFEQGSELLGYYYSVSAFKAGPKQCAVTFVDITERKRAEEINRKSAERAKMQRNLIAQLTFEESIVNSNIDDALKILTSKLSANLQVDRVSVWLLSEDEKQLRRLVLYDANTGLHSQIEVLNTADISSYFEALRKESQVDADDAQNDPRTKELTDNYLIPLQISSLLDSAIQQDGRLIGVLSAEHRGPVRIWHADEESFLSAVTNLVAQLFANAERKQAEDAISQNEEKLKSIFRVAPAGIGVVINRTFTEVNPKVCEMTRYHSEELMGQSASILYPTQEEYEFVGKEKYRQIAKQGTGSVETRWQRKDGKIIDVFLSSTPVDSDDLSKGVTFTALDITDRKRLKDELEILNAELELKVKQRTALLEASNKELETFTYSVSHDLKAPLRGIDGYSKLLLDEYGESLNEEAAHFIKTIRSSTLQMNRLIEDLLSYSRLERSHFKQERIALKSFVERLISNFGEEIKKDQFEVDIKVPEVEIVADSTGLSIALRNFIENALKFSSGKTKPIIEFGFEEKPGSWIIFVKDNGVGFDMKYHDRIFEIFQRLHRAEDFQGTGIGLAMVAKALQRMGGKAWAESTPGEGATFFIEIPKN